MSAADYDDWVTETISEDSRPMHGLNGDILVWNPVTNYRHELSTIGIRVNPESLKIQLELSGQQDFLHFHYHQAIVNNEIPLSIGGGDWSIAYLHAPAEKGAYRRGQRDRLAKKIKGYMQKETSSL